MKKLALSQVCLLCFLASSHAYARSSELSGVLGVGYGIGGDTMLESFYASGGSDKIKANQGISYFGGIDYRFSKSFIARGTIGYKSDDISASNGEISFSRVPLEFTLFHEFNQHRLGAGLAYHTSVSFECNITALCNSTVDFKDASGFLVQYEYAFAPLTIGRFGLGVKYTNIEYETESGGQTFDGSGFDFHLSYMF
ncbi:outer membrane beta-barrel protein [Vibrio quintilis]|uniref:Outer membrane protein beta-barrel domain-containing protein n=1 Tax=Vibrio quintilis TaxID=1117707 RepID=A0A1M7YSZ1_9VIBR|nr:outer membrane beta-barrel protein [Vibrio quintilis]SHO55734.1 hypothetical protein VQ7734_01480 [Vibrio quintilis]